MKIVFQHIPKCAGSSIHRMLVEAFPGRRVHRERLNALDSYGLESLIHHEIFSGHYDAWRVGLVPGPKFVFTFLRDPEARVISLYNFWRSHTWEIIEKRGLAGPRLAKSNSFEDFLKISDSGIPGNIDNVYVRLALGRAQSLEIQKVITERPEEALAKAIRYYQSLDFVGLMEHIEADVPLLCSQIGMDVSHIPFENKGQSGELPNGREAVDPIVISKAAEQLLKERTSLDAEVYRFFKQNPNKA